MLSGVGLDVGAQHVRSVAQPQMGTRTMGTMRNNESHILPMSKPQAYKSERAHATQLASAELRAPAFKRAGGCCQLMAWTRTGQVSTECAIPDWWGQVIDGPDTIGRIFISDHGPPNV